MLRNIYIYMYIYIYIYIYIHIHIYLHVLSETRIEEEIWLSFGL